MDYSLYLKLSIFLGVYFICEGRYKLDTYHAASMNEKLIACIGLLPTTTRLKSSHLSGHLPPGQCSVCPIFRILYEFIRRFSFSTTMIAVRRCLNKVLFLIIFA